MSEDESKDIIISIREVEPELVLAIHKLSEELGRPLRGIMLINPEYVDNKHRQADETGFFEEVICDFNDPNELQRVMKSYGDHLLAVTCRFETAIQLFRKLIPFVPYVNTPSETSLLWSTEKRLMRDRLHGYDASLTPQYRSLTAADMSSFTAKMDELSFPVIVKPNGLNSSLLVTRCDTKEELSACLSQTFAVIEDVYARERGAGIPSLLVEEMIQGRMYSTDAYVDNKGNIYCLPLVEVITAHAIGKPGFYSYRHIIPVDLSEQEVAAAFEAARSAVKALNLSSSTAHIEMFNSPKGWKIIELGPRIGGYREPLYREAYGIDHYYNDLAIRIGLEPKISAELLKHAAGLNIYADEEGIIEAITGLDEARKLPSVVYVAAHAKPGDQALFAGSGGELIVDGILSNTDPDQLERDVRKVRELVQIKVQARREVPQFEPSLG